MIIPVVFIDENYGCSHELPRYLLIEQLLKRIEENVTVVTLTPQSDMISVGAAQLFYSGVYRDAIAYDFSLRLDDKLRLFAEHGHQNAVLSATVAALTTPSNSILLMLRSNSAANLTYISSMLEDAVLATRSGKLVAFADPLKSTIDYQQAIDRQLPMRFPIPLTALNLSNDKNDVTRKPSLIPTGVTMVAAATLLRTVTEHFPEVLIAAELSIAGATISGDWLELDELSYSACPIVPFTELFDVLAPLTVNSLL